MLGRAIILKTAALGPVERLVRGSRLFRPLVRRFIAGDTLEESMNAAEGLLSRGLAVSLDYLGENTRSEAEALQAKATYIQMLERIGDSKAAANWTPLATWQRGADSVPVEPLNISIKLTQCGLDQGEQFARNNYQEVVAAAAGLGNFVRVDMEASEYVERTLDAVADVHGHFPNTGTVLQSYLYRTPDDLERLIGIGARTRIVKGAYLEPSAVAFPEKHKVDAQYVSLAKRMLEAGNYPAIATHDEAIIKEVTTFAHERDIPKSRFEFQMLYGIRRDLQDSLRAEGYPVRVYVPYGDSWYPYFTRRLAERPANGFFILKSLLRG